MFGFLAGFGIGRMIRNRWHGDGAPKTRNTKGVVQILGVCLLGLVLAQVLSGGGPTSAQVAQASPAPGQAISAAWNQFQQDCVAGPSAGQGSTPRACRCWESNLRAASIQPDYAVGVLNAAQVGGAFPDYGDDGYITLENIQNVAVNGAMQGCNLDGSGGGYS